MLSNTTSNFGAIVNGTILEIYQQCLIPTYITFCAHGNTGIINTAINNDLPNIHNHFNPSCDILPVINVVVL